VNPNPAAPTDQIVPGRAQRRLVVTALFFLLVPGIIGIDFWPLTAWRLFSQARTDLQTNWEIKAVDARGRSTNVDLDQLPLGYQLAEWSLAELETSAYSRSEAVCTALLEAVAEERPGTVQLDIVRNDRWLVRRDRDWVVDYDPLLFHSCGTPKG
jgi:hypothetical protein